MVKKMTSLMRAEWAVAFLALACGGQTLEPVDGTPAGVSGGAAGSSTGGSGGTTGGSGGLGGAAPTGCSLAVTASGALPPPLASAMQYAGVATVATDTGFVIAYREQDSAGAARLVVTYLSDDGTLGEPQMLEVPTCPSAYLQDGVGAAYRAGSGLVVTSVPYCDANKGAGAVFAPFDSQGNVSNAAGPQNPAFTKLNVLGQNAVAPSVVTNEFEFIYGTEYSGVATVERVMLQGSEFKSGVSVLQPFGEEAHWWGLVATAPGIRAMMAPNGSQTEIQVSEPTGDLVDAKGSMFLPHAPFSGALAVWNNRVAAVVESSVGRGFAAGKLESGTFTQLDSGLISGLNGNAGLLGSVSMTTLREHLFITDGRNLATLDGINASIDIDARVMTELPALIDGADRSAIAAARSRVLIVQLLSGIPGNWLLLECPE